MSPSNLLLASACVLGVSACGQPMTYQAALTGAQQVPSTASNATGTMTATIQPDTRAMTYTVEYAGLTGPATGAHIHAPAAAGVNAPVAIPFESPASPIKGGITLTQAQLDQMAAGQAYVNIHTATNPGGEIRGQIARVR